LGASSLDAAKASKAASLSATCQYVIYAGCASSALGAPHTYPTLDRDQNNLSASVLASLMPGLPSTWTTPHWCMDSLGSWAYVPHTAAQIQQAGQDVKQHIVTQLTKNATLQAQVAAATTIAELDLIVW
jgi:hypothetical protein